MKKLIIPMALMLVMAVNPFCPECDSLELNGHEAWCSESEECFVDERTHEVLEPEIDEPMDEDTEVIRYINEFKLSYYDCCPTCTDGYALHKTASGTTPVAHRTIAADTSIFPMGTHLYIEGLGEYIVEDTGSAIQGYVLDVYVNDHTEIPSCGVEYRNVYVIEGE